MSPLASLRSGGQSTTTNVTRRAGTDPDGLSYLEVWAGDQLAGTGINGRLFLLLLHGNVQPVAVVGLDEDGQELGSADATHARG